MRVLAVVLIFLFFTGVVTAQTATPTPEPTVTPVPQVARYETIEDQAVRIDYIVTAGDVMVAMLLLLVLFSVWGLGMLMIVRSTGD